MKRSGKIILTVIVLAAIGGATALVAANRGDSEEEIPFVTVERGDIVDKALAVGTIEPRVEVGVKSQFSGVVKREFAEVGDYVKVGAPLLEIQPTPTPKELVDAERQIELRDLEVRNLKDDYERQKALFDPTIT